ncbi:MAG: excinuclease ABC subunit UvrC [Bacteroidaceae bacterium]|nr:excinuclease ABC subunit UvrC [Bacteroidaceae bacterium]
MTSEEKKRLHDKLKNIIANMPEGPGSYQYYNDVGEIIYVGKAKNLKRRVASYFLKEQNHKTAMLVSKIRDIKYINVATEHDALLLENSLIKRFQPRYNILLKDDKSYPYICVTHEDYPRIFNTYNKTPKGGDYYGPYSYAPAMYNLLDLLRSIYKIRNCKTILQENKVRENKYKVCLSYHIKKCSGCCIGKLSREDYQKNIAECRQILKGYTRDVKERLKQEMISLAAEQRFEEAQQLKQKYDLLNQYQAKSEVVSNTIGNVDVFNLVSDEKKAMVNYLHVVNGATVTAYNFEIEKKLDESDEDILRFAIIEMSRKFNIIYKEVVTPFELEIPLEGIKITVPQKGDKKTLLDLSLRNARQYKLDKLKRNEYLNPEQRQTRLMKELQDALHLPKLPLTIELFDNSNLQGTDAVAGCVVFKQMRPSKKDYRKYNIKSVEGADDYASMQEVVRRRYTRLIEEQSPLPDLIITDGGKGQMECVRKVVEDELNLTIPIAGLAKDDRHHTNELLFGFPPIVIGLKHSSELFKILTQMQDEVHRFAISFHKAKRAKRQTKSQLDLIPGIGKTTKELLLKKFKSLKRIKDADIYELQNLLGNKKGEKLWHSLHSTQQQTSDYQP